MCDCREKICIKKIPGPTGPTGPVGPVGPAGSFTDFVNRYIDTSTAIPNPPTPIDPLTALPFPGLAVSSGTNIIYNPIPIPGFTLVSAGQYLISYMLTPISIGNEKTVRFVVGGPLPGTVIPQSRVHAEPGLSDDNPISTTFIYTAVGGETIHLTASDTTTFETDTEIYANVTIIKIA